MSGTEEQAASLAEGEALYGIAELASEFGITQRAIRFYETKGLLAPPRVNGGRVYTRRERARLKLLLRAKSIGFSLAEIRQFLDLYGDHGEGRPRQMAYVAERAAILIGQLEQKQADIATSLRELKEIRSQCLAFLASDEGRDANQTAVKKTDDPR